MRITVTIDDRLLKAAQRESGMATKRAVVEAGLAALMRERRRQRLNAAFGRCAWEGDLRQMREETPVAPA